MNIIKQYEKYSKIEDMFLKQDFINPWRED